MDIAHNWTPQIQHLEYFYHQTYIRPNAFNSMLIHKIFYTNELKFMIFG